MSKRGRKPKFGEAAADELRIRVTPEQRRRLQESARLNLTTVADLVRDAVESYVADFSDDPMFGDRAAAR